MLVFPGSVSYVTVYACLMLCCACCIASLQYFGVDVNTGGVVNTYDAFVWEPALVKLNAIQVGLGSGAGRWAMLMRAGSEEEC